MNEQIFRIFVSSTYIDLIEYRRSAEKAINDLKQKYEGMEYIGAMDKEPTKACLDLIEKCDLFIGIYAWRYGHIPEKSNFSITELEYQHAQKLGISCLCYFVDEDFSWKPKFFETGSAKKKLEQFKNKISANHVRATFKEQHHLEYNILKDLGNWLADNKSELKRDTLKPGQDPAEMYRKAIAKEYNVLAMLGVKRSFEMDGIYIPLTVHVEPESAHNFLTDKIDEKLSPRSLKAEDLVTLSLPHNVAVVLGEPGMGKTTMLHYLARHESKHRNGLLPILVSLANFSKKLQPLESFLLSAVENYINDIAMQNLAKHAMQTGKALILLDGLDEVNRETYSAVTERIRAFINTHGNCRVIITSRKAGFQNNEVPYHIFEIDKLPFAEIENFVNKWFIDETDLMQRIENNDRILELAQNPFLLSIICFIFEKDKSLPNRRVELYKKSTVTLLTLYDERQIPTVNLFTRQLKERILEDTACYFFCQQIDEFPYNSLIEIVSQTLANMGRKENEENILREIRENSGILQQSDDNHLFVHRTFYEYYVSRKMRRTDSQQTVLSRVTEARWEEPIRLYAAQIEPTAEGKKEGTQFLEKIWQNDRALALRCYPDMARVVEPELIKNLLNQAEVDERIKLVKGLPDKITDPDRIVETLRELFLIETNGEVIYWGVQILENINTAESLRIIQQRLDQGAEQRYQEYLKQDMVQVSAGNFKMGSNDYHDEQPIHKVYIDEFSISRYPITNKLYELFDPNHEEKRDKYSQANNQPVIYVNWYEAVMFCRWLGCRLPTEAEWEYACRGGQQSAHYQYSGSNNVEEVAWYYENSGNKTHPVGEKKPNELGIHDMSGNVWEWCADWYGKDYYSKSPAKNPTGRSSGSDRVLRGGSWHCSAFSLRSAHRSSSDPDDSDISVGFRCVH